jgi:hypothetical protein
VSQVPPQGIDYYSKGAKTIPRIQQIACLSYKALVIQNVRCQYKKNDMQYMIDGATSSAEGTSIAVASCGDPTMVAADFATRLKTHINAI